MLTAILILVVIAVLLILFLAWMTVELKQAVLMLYDMMAEVNEADREILLGVDRIEDKLRIVKPEKKGAPDHAKSVG